MPEKFTLILALSRFAWKVSKYRQNEASQKNESAVVHGPLNPILIRLRILSPILHLHSDSSLPPLQLSPDARGEQTR